MLPATHSTAMIRITISAGDMEPTPLFHSHAQYTAEIVFWQGEKMTHTIVEKCWKPVFQH